MNTAEQTQYSNFMRVAYSGGRSHYEKRTVVNESPEGDLVNLMQEIINEGKVQLPTESDFVAEILKAFGVTAEQMEDHKWRKRELVYARQLHMHVRNKIYKMSTTVAGSIYGKDHATVLHANKTVNNLMDTNKDYRETTVEIWKLWQKHKPLPDGWKVE